MNRPYSEATRDMIAEATEQHHIVDGQTTAMGDSPCVCGQWWDASGDNLGWDQHMAEVALDALAAAALLLPEGAETRTEYGVETTFSDGPSTLPSVNLWRARRSVRAATEEFPKRLRERTVWASRWREPDAARLAEEGERVAGRWRTCAGCGDDIWPNERVYPASADGDMSDTAGVLCLVCEVRTRRAEAGDAVRLAEGDTGSALSLSPKASPNEGSVEETPQ